MGLPHAALYLAGSVNAHDMVMTCLRHQMPESYGGTEVPEGAIPSHLRYSTEAYSPPVTVSVPEEPMGAPDAIPLDGHP